jgi:hypothetical protein
MREITTRPFSEAEMQPPPICDACGKQMWWHGSTSGWGCPDMQGGSPGCPDMQGGSPGCRSSLYRPKSNPTERWPYRERYPELKEAT